MKKGFTLIELLGTIMLLGVIALIIFPIANGAIKESKEKAYQVQVDAIIESSHKWGANNTNLLPEENTDVVYNLTLNQLITDGYIEDSKDIKDPRTNEVMDGCVSIKYSSNNNQYIYEYQNKDYCDELPPQVAITIKGEKNEKGWLNEDFYVLISGHGDVFKYCKIEGLNLGDKPCTPDKPIQNNILGMKSLLITDETNIIETYNISTKETTIEAATTYICAQSFSDGEESKSSIQCVNYKFDKTSPFLVVLKTGNYNKTIEIDDEEYNQQLGGIKNGWYSQPISIGLINRDGSSGIVDDIAYLTVGYTQPLKLKNDNIYGDVNGDGLINSVDAVALSQCMKPEEFDCSDDEKKRSDINKDGKIDYIDETILTRYLADWEMGNLSTYTTIYENGKNIPIKIETSDNAGNKVVKTETISIDTIAPSIPEITGGTDGSAFDNEQVISIKTPSTDNLSGLDYYEYYLCHKDSCNAKNKPNFKATGITTGNVIITSAYKDYRIYYRAIDKAGNFSDWSEPKEVNINRTEGDFDFYLTFNYFHLNSITCTNGDASCSYNIKYLKGINNGEYVKENGTDITSSKAFYISSNDIYTIVLYSGSDILKTKQFYLHNTEENSDLYRYINVKLSGVATVGYPKVSSGTIEAKFDNNILNVILNNGDMTSGDGSYTTLSCPDDARGGEYSFNEESGMCEFSAQGTNTYDCVNGECHYVPGSATDNVDCGASGSSNDEMLYECYVDEALAEKGDNYTGSVVVSCTGWCSAPAIEETIEGYAYYGYTFGIEVR